MWLWYLRICLRPGSAFYCGKSQRRAAGRVEGRERPGSWSFVRGKFLNLSGKREINLRHFLSTSKWLSNFTTRGEPQTFFYASYVGGGVPIRKNAGHISEK